MGTISITTIARCKKLLVLPALTLGLAAPATSAQATNCDTNSIGTTHSNGVAAVARTDACAPANGQPAGAGTGRKVG